MAATCSNCVATSARKHMSLELRAVEIAGELFESLDGSDPAKVESLLSEAHICRGQLLARLTGCTAQARPFLQGALGHLERALKAAEPPVPPPPTPAPLPIVVDAPERPKTILCPFCGQPQVEQYGGEYACLHCREWLAGLRARQCKALVVYVAPVTALIVYSAPPSALVVYDPAFAIMATARPGPLESLIFSRQKELA